MQDSLEDCLQPTKNPKQGSSLPISQDLVVTAQLKKECDARAMKIVEFSIEGKLRPEVFTRCLPFINQAHYQDIVEERAITKLCGYSVCGKRIPDMPKKQYFISTKSNKVYDITERKNFCSNFCYKASLHIKKQIDNSPLWLRKLEDIPEYKLLHSSEGGLPGEYIDQGVVKPVEEEMKFTSINAFAQASLGDISEREMGSGKKPKKTGGFKKPSRLKSTMQTIKETEVEEEVTVVSNESTKTTRRIDHKKSMKIIKKEIHKKNCVVSLPSIEENEERLQNTKENDCDNVIRLDVVAGAKLDQIKQERLEEETEIEPLIEDQIPNENALVIKTERNIEVKTEEISIKTEPPEKKTANKKSIKKKPIFKAPDIENIVTKALEEWVTLETCIFIHGDQKVKRILNEKKLSDYFDELHVQELQKEQQMRYMDICRRLQLQEMADDKFDKAFVGGTKLKPLPDFRKLKEDTKDLQLKVKSFYDGSMYEQDDKNFPTRINNKQGQEGDPEEGPPAVLPPVDVHSHNLLRRKIFLSSLSKAVAQAQNKEFSGDTLSDVESLPTDDASLSNIYIQPLPKICQDLNRIQQVLQSLGASYSTVLSDVQALVRTFNLKADNITFKPLVWTYVAVVLVHLLSLKDAALKELLEERRSQEYIQILFEALPTKRYFVPDVLGTVMDVESFVERYVTRKDSNNV